MEEIWKEIEGFKGYYVSNKSRVKSDKKVLKQKIGNQGYSLATLFKDGKKFEKTIHRLIAISFIPNPNNLPTVNHIDGDKANNSIKNLEWASYSENNRHAYRTGLKRRFFGTDNPKSRVVCQYNNLREKIDEFISIVEANKQTGINKSHISSCCMGRRKTAGGYIWEHKNLNNNVSQ